MKRPARARSLGGDSAVARWFERVRLANRWEAASAEAVDESHDSADGIIGAAPDDAADRLARDISGL